MGNHNKGAIVLLLLTLFVQPSGAQKVVLPDPFLRIIPGVSTRADVEKLYPLVQVDNHFAKYRSAVFSIGVKFSLGPCEIGHGDLWGLPEWTVERVYYTWPDDRRVRLQDIVLDKSVFQKKQLGDVIGHDYYINDELGIVVVYDRKEKSVMDLELKPSKILRQKYSCYPDH